MSDPFEAARTRHRAGDLAGAKAAYSAILAQTPDHARARAGLGVIALQSGDAQAAARDLAAAAEQAPGDPLILNNLGNARMALGDAAGAEAAFDAAVRHDPQDVGTRYNRAVARHRLRRLAEAQADYEAVLAADPGRLEAAVNLAALHREREDPGAGIAILSAAVAQAGRDPEAQLALAELNETVGEIAAAQAALAALPASRQSDPRACLVRARLHLRAGEAEAGLTALAALPVGVPAQAQRQALALRALLLDRAGRMEEAFEGFREANAAMAASRPDAAALAARYHRRIAAYRDALAGPPPTFPDPDPLPFGLVFFCGFPRSGTTLMEQILDAHPATATTGEDSPLQRLCESLPPPADPRRNDPADTIAALTAAERNRLRAAFTDLVNERHGDMNGRVLIDKLPLNLVELGVIARLFPDARILVAIRDPRDCVLSAFMQPFRLNDAMACLLTLEDAAETYAAVFDLYAAQKDAARLPIHEYRYEDLIDDFDGTVRTTLAFLGLPWDDRLKDYRAALAGRYIATPSYMTVTQSLSRRAIGRWRRYEAPMAAVADRLAPYVRRFGYPGA
jgi:tetratricopeptide (TPR) repeat protein